MDRFRLILLQILVAVVGIVLWHVLTTWPIFGHVILPPFFFSNPFDVAQQIVAWFVSGVIWKHLWVTLSESVLAFVIGSERPLQNSNTWLFCSIRGRYCPASSSISCIVSSISPGFMWVM